MRMHGRGRDPGMGVNAQVFFSALIASIGATCAAGKTIEKGFDDPSWAGTTLCVTPAPALIAAPAASALPVSPGAPRSTPAARLTAAANVLCTNYKKRYGSVTLLPRTCVCPHCQCLFRWIALMLTPAAAASERRSLGLSAPYPWPSEKSSPWPSPAWVGP